MRPSASVLALFAHPDDETFRCGGTFALLARRGVAVHVLTATRGQAGSCGEPPLCSREELGAMREAELRCSCHALGLEPPVLLDYQDGALADVPKDEAVARVAAHLRAIRPQVLLTWPPHGLSGHTDHMAVSRWATAAYRRAQAEGLEELTALYYLAVPRSVAVSADALGLRQLRALPDDEVSVTVDVGPAWDAKMAAIRCGDRGDRGDRGDCHRTQLGESPILRAPPERQRLFLGAGHFQRAASRSAGDVLSGLNHT